jgi:hypothetical protein
MGLITIQCPRSGQKVSTGVEIDRRAFEALPANGQYRMHCWVCGDDHRWSKRWAEFVENEKAVPSGVVVA